MEISRTATGILVAACVAVGAGGAYLAVKRTAPIADSQQIDDPSGSPVTESEALVNSGPVAKSPAPSATAAPESDTAPRRRARGPAASPAEPVRVPEPPAPAAAPVVAQ